MFAFCIGKLSFCNVIHTVTYWITRDVLYLHSRDLLTRNVWNDTIDVSWRMFLIGQLSKNGLKILYKSEDELGFQFELFFISEHFATSPILIALT